MAAPWEVVLHFDYRGVPGVVFDRSPGRGAHGRLRNLTAGDFRADGRSPGSGALQFRGGESGVRVELKHPWNILRGIIIQFSCTKDVILRPGTLLDSDSFTLQARPPNLRLALKSSTQTWDLTTSVSDPGGSWVDVSASYELKTGIYYAGAMAEGQATDLRWHGFLQPVRRLMIGNRLTGGDGVTGLIDDVRISRIDPNQVDKNFLGRPPDPAVSSCWDDWIRTMIRLLKEDKECALTILANLQSVQNSVLGAALGPETATQVLAAAQAYAQHWAAGQLGDITPVAADLISFLKSKGIDMAANQELVNLLEDPCFRRLAEKMPPLDCDPDLTTMLTGIAEGL